MGVRTTRLDPKIDELPHLELITMKAGGRGKCVLTCCTLYEAFTHFIAGRTLPCMEDDCAACSTFRPARYEAFASVVWVHNRRHQLLRLTKNAVVMLKTQLAEVNSMRGYVIEVERRTARANGRLLVNLSDGMVPWDRLPEEPDLAAHLSRIWRIDGLEPGSDDRAYVAQYQAFLAEAEASKGVKDAG